MNTPPKPILLVRFGSIAPADAQELEKLGYFVLCTNNLKDVQLLEQIEGGTAVRGCVRFCKWLNGPTASHIPSLKELQAKMAECITREIQLGELEPQFHHIVVDQSEATNSELTIQP